LEAIAEQIEQYEKWEPKWDITKIITSVCATITLYGIGLILDGFCFEDVKPKFLNWIIIITGIAGVGTLIGFVQIYRHHKQNKLLYAMEAIKLKTILDKVRKSIL
jgi:hypothetical protein